MQRLELLTKACSMFEMVVRLADVPDVTDARSTMRTLGTSLGLALGLVFGDERANGMARTFIDGLIDP